MKTYAETYLQYAAEIFEDEAQAKRFLSSVDNAKNFMRKAYTLPLRASQAACLAYMEDPYDGILAAYYLGFRHGYNKAKKDAKD